METTAYTMISADIAAKSKVQRKLFVPFCFVRNKMNIRASKLYKYQDREQEIYQRELNPSKVIEHRRERVVRGKSCWRTKRS